MDAKANYGPVEEMRMRLIEWLDAPSASSGVLLDWLQGYDLPGPDRDDHTFLSVVRAFPIGGDRQKVCAQLAAHAARILEQSLKKVAWTRPPMVLTNLLLLCANLRRPQELAEPLWNWLCFLREAPVRPEFWKSETSQALRSALITNQIDGRLKPVWEALVSGQEDSVLLTDRYAGWEGARRMPETVGDLTSPDMSMIGFALKQMAEYLGVGPEKRIAFRKLMVEVRSYFGGGKNFDLQLLRQADKHAWPEWTVECHPSLYIECGLDFASSLNTALIWKNLVLCIPESFQVEVAPQSICHGKICLLKMNDQAMAFVRDLASWFLPEFASFPFDSHKSIVGCFSDKIVQLLEITKSDNNSVRKSLMKAHQKIAWQLNYRPRIAEIRGILSPFAEASRANENAAQDFGKLVQVVSHLYPAYPNWKQDLQSFSQQDQWPKEAVEKITHINAA